MDWLELYEEYTSDTESAALFNRWVGISTVASALRKKTWLELGRLKVFPNMYIVLVAEPGVARKSQAISYASSIISDIPAIVTSADSITPQALIQDIEEATCYDTIPGQSVMRHASLSVISKEFESFLGNAGSSSKMLVTLTDLFDAGENPWKHRTKSSGNTLIPSVFLNILGATTPQSLQSCLSELAVGGGLTSRIMFIYSNKPSKKVAVPELTPRVRELKDILSVELMRISLLAGAFVFTEDGLNYWKKWYEDYNATSKDRRQPRREFDGWYSRKPMMVQKLCIIISASGSSNRLIDIEIIEKALVLIEEMEEGMGCIFPDEKTRIHAEVTETRQSNLLLRYIRQYVTIEEKHLMHLVWRDIDEDELDMHIDLLLRNKQCERKFESPDGVTGIWYYYKEKVNES